MLYRGFLFMPLLRVPLLVSPLLPIYGELGYGRVWSAENKAWAYYVLGIGREL